MLKNNTLKVIQKKLSSKEDFLNKLLAGYFYGSIIEVLDLQVIFFLGFVLHYLILTYTNKTEFLFSVKLRELH